MVCHQSASSGQYGVQQIHSDVGAVCGGYLSGDDRSKCGAEDGTGEVPDMDDCCVFSTSGMVRAYVL